MGPYLLNRILSQVWGSYRCRGCGASICCVGYQVWLYISEASPVLVDFVKLSQDIAKAPTKLVSTILCKPPAPFFLDRL